MTPLKPETKQEIRSLVKECLGIYAQKEVIKAQIEQLNEQIAALDEPLHLLEEQISQKSKDIDHIVMVNLGNDPCSDKAYSIAIDYGEVIITEGVMI